MFIRAIINFDRFTAALLIDYYNDSPYRLLFYLKDKKHNNCLITNRIEYKEENKLITWVNLDIIHRYTVRLTIPFRKYLEKKLNEKIFLEESISICRVILPLKEEPKIYWLKVNDNNQLTYLFLKRRLLLDEFESYLCSPGEVTHKNINNKLRLIIAGKEIIDQNLLVEDYQLDSIKNAISEFGIARTELLNSDELYFENNKLGLLPIDVDAIKNIRSLSLSNNCIFELGDILYYMKNLRRLEIAETDLRKLELDLRRLPRLEELVIRDFYGELKFINTASSDLKILSIEKTFLNSIPKEIFQLGNLEELSIVSNHLIHFLPEGLSNLSNLVRLYLYENNLKCIPEEIGYLNHLEVLNLSHNLVEQLPKEITMLGKLKTLSLDYNPIKELPNDIFELDNLIRLSAIKTKFNEDVATSNYLLKTNFDKLYFNI